MGVVTKAKTATRPAHDELAALDQAIRDADARHEATRRIAQERLAPLPGVISTEGTAWAQGREADAENAREQRAALEAEAQTWRLRMTACQSACDDARAARKSFAHDNGDALIAEMARRSPRRVTATSVRCAACWRLTRRRRRSRPACGPDAGTAARRGRGRRLAGGTRRRPGSARAPALVVAGALCNAAAANWSGTCGWERSPRRAGRAATAR